MWIPESKKPLPFVCLGYNFGGFWFARADQKIIGFTFFDEENISKIFRFLFCRKPWREFFDKAELVLEYVARSCEEIGIYDPGRIRDKDGHWRITDDATHYIGERPFPYNYVSPLEWISSDRLGCRYRRKPDGEILLETGTWLNTDEVDILRKLPKERIKVILETKYKLEDMENFYDMLLSEAFCELHP